MSSYKSFVIQSKEEFCEWILRKLGHPLITVELTEDHIIDAIDEAVEEFTKYVNQERKYMALNLADYNSTSGFILPDCCTGIFALEGDCTGSGAGFGGINTLFSIGNQMQNAGFNFNFSSGGGGAESWITYEASMQYLDLIKRMTASEFRFEYNNRTHSLTLIPDPVKQSAPNTPKGHIAIGCNVIREEQQQYGESWVKRYALALSKITLGIVRAKFQGVQLLGGGVIDPSIKEEGIVERDQLLENLKETEGSFMTFYLG